MNIGSLYSLAAAIFPVEKLQFTCLISATDSIAVRYELESNISVFLNTGKQR